MRGPGGGAVVAYPSRSSKEFLCCPGLALPAPTGFRRPPYQSLPVAMVLLQVAWFASPLAPLANIQAGAHSAAEQRGGQQRRWAETSLQDWDPQPCSAAAANFFFFFYFWEEKQSCEHLLPQFPHLCNDESCLLGPEEKRELYWSDNIRRIPNLERTKDEVFSKEGWLPAASPGLVSSRLVRGGLNTLPGVANLLDKI